MAAGKINTDGHFNFIYRNRCYKANPVINI